MDDAQDAARKPAVPAMMSSQMYLTILRTVSHQGSLTLILAAAAFSGSSTMERICSAVSLIFIGIIRFCFLLQRYAFYVKRAPGVPFSVVMWLCVSGDNVYYTIYSRRGRR